MMTLSELSDTLHTLAQRFNLRHAEITAREELMSLSRVCFDDTRKPWCWDFELDEKTLSALEPDVLDACAFYGVLLVDEP